MRNLQSLQEGVWAEIKPVILTEEQKQLLASSKPEDQEAKLALEQSINEQRYQPVSEEDLTRVQQLYEFKKPVLSETDEYFLIAVDMVLNGPFTNGIINCRVNNEHKQIRF